MRQLVPQRAVDFGCPELLQGGIQRNKGTAKIRATDSGAHAIIPIYPQSCREVLCSRVVQQRCGTFL